MEGSVNAVAISSNLSRIRATVPAGIEIVAVSKFQPAVAVEAAYEAGQRVFGESRVQELLDKSARLPSDIRWHFIGHLQTNKVKALVGVPSVIESIDSERLLLLIDAESKKKNVVSDVYLQVYVAEEETKFGFAPEELKRFFDEKRFSTLTHTRICGLMAMATNTDDEAEVRREFAEVASLFRYVKMNHGLPCFSALSMGMSGDWPIAVEEGATSIRIGTAIFGERH